MGGAHAIRTITSSGLVVRRQDGKFSTPALVGERPVAVIPLQRVSAIGASLNSHAERIAACNTGRGGNVGQGTVLIFRYNPFRGLFAGW